MLSIACSALLGIGRPEFATEHCRVVHELLARYDLNDLHEIELVLGVLLATNHEARFEALMVCGPVERLAVTHAVEFEAFQRLDDSRRIECAGALAGIGIEQRLNVAGVCGL